MSRTLVDQSLADAEVIPTSTTQLPQEEAVVPIQDLVNDALAHRADLAENRIALANQQISQKAIRSALLPSLDAFAYYGGSGLGGIANSINVRTRTFRLRISHFVIPQAVFLRRVIPIL